MPTAKKRINVSLAPDLERELTRAAKRDNVPEATKAALLLRTALELEEDTTLDKLASERYRTAKKWVAHAEVWEN